MRYLVTCLFFVLLSFGILIVFIPSPPIFSQDTLKERFIIKYNSLLTDDQRQQIVDHREAEVVAQIPQLNADIVHIGKNQREEHIRRLRRDSRISYIEPDYVATAYELTNDSGVINNLQWGLITIQAAGKGESAWNITKGSSEIKVAVLDTGIDTTHEDIKGKIVGEKNCTDTISSNDYSGHGTHVAGIIGAVTNNKLGIAGVGYNVTLLNAKGLDDSGSGYYSWIAECLVWATDQGAQIINMSLGGTSNSKILKDAISYAHNKGVVIVVAAGNAGSSSPSYPAYYSEVIAVAATDQNDRKASFSNFGNWVDVVAPGVSVYSTLPQHANTMKKEGYGYLSGTSMASPFVAGLASLLFALGIHDGATVTQLIYENADKIEGTGLYWTYGRINAYKSVKAAISLPTHILTPTPTPYFLQKFPWLKWCSYISSFCR